MFGRKKRRQEPIPAVAPEPLASEAWQPTVSAEGDLAADGVVVDGRGPSPVVSRETDPHEGIAVGGHADLTGGDAGPSDDRVQAGDAATSPSAAEASVGEQNRAALGGPAVESGDRVHPENGERSSLDGHGGGSLGPWSAGSVDPEREAPSEEPPVPRESELASRLHAVDVAGPDAAGSSGLDRTDVAGLDAAGNSGLDGMDNAGLDATDITRLDTADSAGPQVPHSAFSTAPRTPADQRLAPAVVADVSRETARQPRQASSVGSAGVTGRLATPDAAPGQPTRTGENEDVSSQPEVIYGAGHDDEARRAALVDSLPDADDDTPLMAQIQADAKRRIQLRGRKFPRPAQTRIITVANQKGGVGKTTTTVNLAAALAQSGLNVLVLDNDPQGNASTALGVAHHAGTPSIYEVLVDEAPMAGAVQECPDVPNLWCVPATIDLSGAEIELVSMVARETRLRIALDAYLTGRIAAGQEPIDYVFVDCPPSLGLLTVNAFVVGREVLIPIQCEYYALEGLTQLLKTIQLIQAHLNPGLHVSTILLTMYDSRTNLAQQVAQEVRDHFPETTLRTSVPRSVRISEAPSYGQTVITYDAGSSGALAYLEAARELAERGAADKEPASDSAGAAPSSSLFAVGGDRINHTTGTSGGSSSVVGSIAGSYQEEQ